MTNVFMYFTHAAVCKCIQRRVSGKDDQIKKAREWEADAFLELCIQKAPRPFFKGKLKAEYKFSFKDKRRSDIQNREKLVSDLLQKYGVFEDDFQIDESHCYRLPVGKGTVEVTITEIS